MVISRRTLFTAAGGGAGLFALSACGGDETVPTGGASAGGAEDDAYPRTVEHSFGETVLDASPARVASLGYTDHDALMALGVLPVLVTRWFPDYVVGPWAQEARAALGGTDPVVIQQVDGIPFEEVAGAEPHLVTAVYSGLEEGDYATLSDIAPTVARVPGNAPWESTWDSQLALVGDVLGKPDEAAELSRRVSDQLTGLAEQHPEFAGRTISLLLAQADGALYAWTQLDPRVDLATTLGFTLAPAVAALPGADEEFSVELSEERLDVVDADVVLVVLQEGQTAESLAQRPTWSALPAVQQGRVLHLPTDPYGYALSFGTVLSVPFAATEVARQLSELLAGAAR